MSDSHVVGPEHWLLLVLAQFLLGHDPLSVSTAGSSYSR
jgi:hypothetical protein